MLLRAPDPVAGGGALYAGDSTLTVADTHFEANRSGARPVVDNCIAEGGRAWKKTGIANGVSSLPMCRATSLGGAVHIIGASLSELAQAHLERVAFVNNSVNDTGGGLAMLYGLLDLTGCTFTGNFANRVGLGGTVLRVACRLGRRARGALQPSATHLIKHP